MNRCKHIAAPSICMLLLLAFLLAAVPHAAAVEESYRRAAEGEQSEEVPIKLKVIGTQPFAGIQFGLTLSDDTALQYLRFDLGDDIKGAHIYPEHSKNGVYYFGFYTDTNAFQGELIVGTVYVAYTGSAPQTVTLSEMDIFRVANKRSVRYSRPSPVSHTYISRADADHPPDTGATTITILDEDTPLSGLTGSFEDVFLTDWFFEDVEFVYERGLMFGTDAQRMIFSPHGKVTRGMVATVLYRAAGSPDVSGRALPFADVQEGTWYTDAIRWGDQTGVILGYGNGLCGPEDIITREQLATLMYRYEVLSRQFPANVQGEQTYLDQADVGAWAIDGVRAMSTQGIMTGKPGNLFDPQGETTRAELAAVLHRFVIAVEPAQ